MLCFYGVQLGQWDWLGLYCDRSSHNETTEGSLTIYDGKMYMIIDHRRLIVNALYFNNTSIISISEPAAAVTAAAAEVVVVVVVVVVAAAAAAVVVVYL